MSYRLIPLEKFDYDVSTAKTGFAIFKRVLSLHTVTTYGSTSKPPYSGIRRISEQEYVKVVPCNPLLNFFGLLRYDKNREDFSPTEEVRFADKAAEEYYKKYGKNINSATLMSMAWERPRQGKEAHDALD